MLLFIFCLISLSNIMCRFNTSHVTLYHMAAKANLIMTKFQYISCYSLSFDLPRIHHNSQCFNTSHVTLYPSFWSFSKFPASRFNTSHVTLYQVWCKEVAFDILFQYISCYSLSLRQLGLPGMQNVSIHLMLLFISLALCRKNVSNMFQYISCYSLSLVL